MEEIINGTNVTIYFFVVNLYLGKFINMVWVGGMRDNRRYHLVGPFATRLLSPDMTILEDSVSNIKRYCLLFSGF
jgi:hypothetical protein